MNKNYTGERRKILQHVQFMGALQNSSPPAALKHSNVIEVGELALDDGEHFCRRSLER